jgi:hypothetical protein
MELPAGGEYPKLALCKNHVGTIGVTAKCLKAWLKKPRDLFITLDPDDATKLRNTEKAEIEVHRQVMTGMPTFEVLTMISFPSG